MAISESVAFLAWINFFVLASQQPGPIARACAILKPVCVRCKGSSITWASAVASRVRSTLAGRQRVRRLAASTPILRSGLNRNRPADVLGGVSRFRSLMAPSMQYSTRRPLTWCLSVFSVGSVSVHQGSGEDAYASWTCGGSSIPTFIEVSDGKLHDVNILDGILCRKRALLFYGDVIGAILDFERLYALHRYWRLLCHIAAPKLLLSCCEGATRGPSTRPPACGPITPLYSSRGGLA